MCGDASTPRLGQGRRLSGSQSLHRRKRVFALRERDAPWPVSILLDIFISISRYFLSGSFVGVLGQNTVRGNVFINRSESRPVWLRRRWCRIHDDWVDAELGVDLRVEVKLREGGNRYVLINDRRVCCRINRGRGRRRFHGLRRGGFVQRANGIRLLHYKKRYLRGHGRRPW